MSDTKKENRIDPQNATLAATATSAITNPAFERRGGYCQRFVRQVVQRAHGSRYDRFHKSTAEASRKAWIAGGYAVNPKNGSVIGDILYKAATREVPEGHVGIRVAGNRVAENSTTSLGRVQGAKGFRTLEEFGAVKTIVRLRD